MSQTTLSDGDMAIIGMDTGDEDFSFVCFVDIDAGTEIYFTDEEADGDYTIGTGEGSVLFTAPTGGITAGTVITYVGNSSYFTTTSDGSITLSNSGDGLLAYQGSSVGNPTTFLHAIGEDSGDLGSFPGGFSNYMTIGSDDGQYNGTRTGTATALMTEINDNSNWTTSGSGVTPFNTSSFTISGAASGPAISNISHSPTTPTSSQTVNVTADVTDADGIFGVELHWGTSSGSPGNTISMSNSSGDTYQTDTDIPAQSDGTTIYYEVYAIDNNADDNTSAEFNYTVTDPSTVVIIHEDDFSNCGTTQWTEESVASNKDWTCGSGGFEINAYSGSAAAEDYLISPEINLDNYTNEELSFQSWTRYSDAFYPAVELLYTTNYTGDPSTTSWNSSLSATFSAENSQSWTSSGIIDISGITGTAVRFAFKYTSSGTGGSSTSYWKIDDVLIEGENASAGITLSMTDDGSITEGNESTEEIDVKVLGDTLAASLNISNWTFSNLPSGVSVASVNRQNDSIAKLTLSGNATTDYDTDITNFTVDIDNAELKNLSSGTETVNTGVTFIANNDAESISMTDDGAIYEGSENGEIITVNLSGGNFVDPLSIGNWSLTNQPTGVSIGSLNRISDTEVEITLNGNASSDYSTNITNTELAIDDTEIDDHSGSDITTNSGLTFIATSISMTDDGNINEANENGEVITITVAGDNFVGSLDITNWTFTNLPNGVTASNLVRNSNTEAQITLSGNTSSDYDNNITNFTIEINNAEFVNLASGSETISSGVTFIANNDAETITIADDGNIIEGSEDGEVITVNLSGGNFVDPLSIGNWSIINQPSGVSIGSLNRVSDTEVEIILNGNASSDYDADITDTEISIDSDEIDDHSGADISANSGVKFIALIEPAPTVQASDISFTGSTSTSISLSWTRGNGDNCLVICKENDQVDSIPNDSVDYNANSIFGSGDDLGDGNYVVYKGSGNSLTVNGLSQGFKYHFRVFEFNNTDTNTRYITSTATLNPDSSLTTLSNVSNFNVDCISKTTARLSWTNPGGVYEGIIIVARESTLVPHVLNGKGDTINADTVFGDGYEFGLTTPKSYVVYNGTGNYVEISGLTPNTDYTFKAYTYYEDNWSSGTTKSAQQTIIPEVSNLNSYAPSNEINIAWTNPVFSCADEVMVVMKQGASVTTSPSGDGSSYTADASFGNGTDIGTNEFVVFKGTNNKVEISNVFNGNEYYFKVFVRDGSDWSDGVVDTITPEDITILFPGDLAILSINTSIYGGDELSIICFDTIKSGTEITFTDNGYERANPEKWGNTEGTITYERTGSDILPGEVFTFRGAGHTAGDFSGVGLSDNSWSISSSNGNHDFNLNSDDQVWIMQYGVWNPGTNNGHDATYSGNVLYGWTATGWAGDPGHGTGTKYSALYPFATCFNTNVVNTSHEDKVKYTGPTTAATQREWIQRINNADNWTGYSSNTNYENASTPQYSSGLQLTILPAVYSEGEWIGDRDSNWFYCGNWGNLAIPDENIDVMINANAQKNAVISSSASYSDEFNDTAKCKSISISSDTLKLISDDALLIINENLEINGGVLSADESQIDLKGDFTASQSGSFIDNNSILNIVGYSQQNITNNNATEVFSKIYLNNSMGLKLGGDIETDSLKIISGDVYLQDYDLKINTGLSGYDNSNYIITKNNNNSGGFLIMPVTSSGQLFPVGNSSSYNPVTITNTAPGSIDFKLRTFDSIYENGYSGNSLTGQIVNKSFAIELNTAPSATVNINFQWNFTDEMPSFGANRNNAVIIQNDGSGSGISWDDWTLINNFTAPSGSGPYNMQGTNINNFGVFAIGVRCEILKPNTSAIYHY